MVGNLIIEVLQTSSLIDGVEHLHSTQGTELPTECWDRKQEHSPTDPEQKCSFGGFLAAPQLQDRREPWAHGSCQS